MKNKLIISIIILALILMGIVFANSYVQALSKRQINTQAEDSQFYESMEEIVNNCNNICEQNEGCQMYQQKEDCPMYQQNENCITHNNHNWQRNCNNTRNYDNQQHHHNRGCNR